MSKIPENLPKRTRVLVKDILFQEKYRLTHTQVDIMAYIINALTWTTKVGAFFPVTNKKFHEDLPQISEKTLEESLRALKAMGLIEVQMITVPQWNNAYVRGISVLPKGLEYNSGYYKADEKKIINSLEIKIIELEAKLKELDSTEEEKKILKKSIEQDDGINYNDLEFTTLIKTVNKDFILTSKPICNMVKGWKKETKFYINSYNRLSVLSPDGQLIQLKDPMEINDFWKYLYRNKHQIGKVVDFTKELTIDELNYRYAKMEIKIQEHTFRVYKIEKLKDGVKVSLSKSGSDKVSVISKDGKAKVFGLEECENALLGLRY